MAMRAPIILFAFNRPQHLQKTLEALAANEMAGESDLYIFCDGPRHAQDEALCLEVRKIADGATGFKSVTVKKQSDNLGLAPSVIAGVTQLVNKEGRVIVMEDDLVTSPYFLRYMNDGLNLYANNPKVASIHGWCFPHNVPAPPETFFLRGADCWGWATWKRAWDLFESDAGLLLDKLKANQLIHEFNLDGTYSYTDMLQQVFDGTVSSWAVRWHASVYLADCYTLYPGRTLVHNIGLDDSGTHCSTTGLFDSLVSLQPCPVNEIPVRVEPQMLKALVTLFSKNSKHGSKSFMKKLKKSLKKRLGFFSKEEKKEAPKRDVLEWAGEYADWESALSACGEGYSSDLIFERVANAAHAVYKGDALWERDSVLFYNEEYSWPFVASLMSVAAQHNGHLHVLDFGGALGSTYYQNKRFLNALPDISWHIVEQPHIVDYGQKHFPSGLCKFHASMAECLKKNDINVILFSSVLQYMSEPYALLQEAIDIGPSAIIIDRTPFLPNQEKITVQHVPEEIYPATYPCWWLNRNHVESLLAKSYSCFPDYPSPVDPSGFYGFLAIKRKDHV